MPTEEPEPADEERPTLDPNLIRGAGCALLVLIGAFVLLIDRVLGWIGWAD